jgi:hypothetical protein
MALTNHEGEHISKLLKIKNFHGVYLQEDMKNIKDKAKDGSYIINYGTLKNGGTHYVALLMYGTAAFHFDSFGATYSTDIEDFIKGKPNIGTPYQSQQPSARRHSGRSSCRGTGGQRTFRSWRYYG